MLTVKYLRRETINTADVYFFLSIVGMLTIYIGMLFTAMGAFFTSIGMLFTNTGILFTNMGVLPTNIGMFFTNIDMLSLLKFHKHKSSESRKVIAFNKGSSFNPKEFLANFFVSESLRNGVIRSISMVSKFVPQFSHSTDRIQV